MKSNKAHNALTVFSLSAMLVGGILIGRATQAAPVAPLTSTLNVVQASYVPGPPPVGKGLPLPRVFNPCPPWYWYDGCPSALPKAPKTGPHKPVSGLKTSKPAVAVRAHTTGCHAVAETEDDE